MKKKLIVGNWKMNGSLAANQALIAALKESLSNQASIARALPTAHETDMSQPRGTEEGPPRAEGAVPLPGGSGDSRSGGRVAVAVAVPAPYLAQLQSLLAGSRIALAAQDLSQHAAGAYTGEISAQMLQDFAVRYTLVGHSERRQYHGETDAQVAAKAQRALAAGITPIVCVGETLQEREAGETEAVVKRQLAAVVQAVGHCVTELVVAYEPVWAIGTGRTATPEQAQQVHAVLRAQLAAATTQAQSIALLYGGSMNASNAAQLLAQPDIDGGLVGGAALKAADFLQIIAAAKSAALIR